MEDQEKPQVVETVDGVADINEVAGETPDQESLDAVEESLPQEELPQADVEQQQDEEPDESIEPAAVSEQEECSDEAETKSVSSLTFRSATTLRALSEELKSGVMAETFAMEIDEIDLFLGRTMHSIVQKLA